MLVSTLHSAHLSFTWLHGFVKTDSRKSGFRKLMASWSYDFFFVSFAGSYAWRAAREMKSVVICSASTDPYSFSCMFWSYDRYDQGSACSVLLALIHGGGGAGWGRGGRMGEGGQDGGLSGVGQISSLSNRWFLQSWRMCCVVHSASPQGHMGDGTRENRLPRIIYKIATLAYKFFDGSLPPYLSVLLETYIPAHTLQSSSERLLKTPKTNLNFPGNRAFHSQAPHIWNSLPSSLSSLTFFSKNISFPETFS